MQRNNLQHIILYEYNDVEENVTGFSKRLSLSLFPTLSPSLLLSTSHCWLNKELERGNRQRRLG